MIAEHEFVTTFEQPEAMAAAASILARMGFRIQTQEPSRLTAKRGKAKPATAKHERQLPQRIELSYDRGRCILAASITPAGKPLPLHRDMVTTALTTIERILVHGMAEDEALEAWRYIDDKANKKINKPGCRRLGLVALITVLSLVAIMALIALFASMAAS